MSLQIPEELNPAALDKMMSLVMSTILPRVHFGNQEQPSALLVPVAAIVRGIKLELAQQYPLHLQRVEFFSNNNQRLQDDEITVEASSVYKDKVQYAAKNVLRTGNLFFHSKKEQSPWLEFHFNTQVNLSHLIIHNANPGYFWRSYSLKIIETSNSRLIYDNYAWCDALERIILASALCGAISNNDASLRLATLYAKFYATDKLRALVEQQKRHDNRIAVIDRANMALSRYGHGFTHHGINRTFHSFTREEKIKTVKTLQKVIVQLQQRLDISCFITSGTLLGFVRDQELLGHDDDLDICYISHHTTAAAIVNERNELITVLTELGYRAKISASKTHIQAKLAGGVNLDLFVAFESNDHIDASPLPRGLIPRDQILPLGTIKAYGFHLPAPKNIDLYLSINYGPNWHMRDPSWRFDWARARREYAFLLQE